MGRETVPPGEVDSEIVVVLDEEAEEDVVVEEVSLVEEEVVCGPQLEPV